MYGVTEIVAVLTVTPSLVTIKEGIAPLPDDANPMEVLLFVQL